MPLSTIFICINIKTTFYLYLFLILTDILHCVHYLPGFFFFFLDFSPLSMYFSVGSYQYIQSAFFCSSTHLITMDDTGFLHLWSFTCMRVQFNNVPLWLFWRLWTYAQLHKYTRTHTKMYSVKNTKQHVPFSSSYLYEMMDVN